MCVGGECAFELDLERAEGALCIDERLKTRSSAFVARARCLDLGFGRRQQPSLVQREYVVRLDDKSTCLVHFGFSYHWIVLLSARTISVFPSPLTSAICNPYPILMVSISTARHLNSGTGSAAATETAATVTSTAKDGFHMTDISVNV